MKAGAFLTAIFIFFTAFALAMPDYADAARMGGGRSFGSRPSMSRPAQAPRQSTTQQRQATVPNSGLNNRGMMGGLFGGLLAGTLLGSLLGGHGMGGGGGFLDLILLGILVFVGYSLYKRFRNRQTQQPAQAGPGYYNQGNDDPIKAPLQRTDGGADVWSRLKAAVSARDAGNSGQGSFGGENSVPVPPDFDAKEFIQGAKAAYVRMQESWDKRDLEDISHFATAAVMANLQEQMREDPNPSHTELMMIDAQLLGVTPDGNGERAEVYFDVLMKEDPNQQTPENVREIWHFYRVGPTANWKLDGIQQVI